jgi:hypothetical protein
MHTAVRSTSVNLVKYFSKRPNSWVERNSDGLTPVELAAKMENEALGSVLVELLLENMKKRDVQNVAEGLLRICTQSIDSFI